MSVPEASVFRKHYTLTFGKYKGKKIEDVIEEDPKYLLWAHENIEWFQLSDEALEDVLLLTTGRTIRKTPPKLTPNA